MRQRTRQLRRRGDLGRQGLNIGRKCGRLSRRVGPPMGRRLGIQRGLETIGERDGQRRFITARDAHLVEYRREVAGRGAFEQPGQGALFRRQAGGLACRLAFADARGSDQCFRFEARLFRRGQAGARRRRRLLGLRQGRRRGGDGIGIGLVGRQRVEPALFLANPAIERLQTLFEVSLLSPERDRLGLRRRDIFGQLSEFGIERRDCRAGRVERARGGLTPGRMLLRLGRKRVGFNRQPALDRLSFALLAGFMSIVGGQLPGLLIIFGDGAGQLALFGDKRIASGQNAGVSVSKCRLVFAQRRQSGGAIGIARGRLGHIQHRLPDRVVGGHEVLAGVVGAGQQSLPAQRQQHGVGAADLVGQFAVADRLARLFLEMAELGLHRAQNIVEPLEICLGGAQLEFCLVAPGMQTGNAGGVLEHLAAFGRLGIDKARDAPLADQRRGRRATGGVGKQRLDIAGAGGPPADAIIRALAAFDPARALEFARSAQPRDAGRQRAVLIEGDQGHFRDIAGRAGRGAAEDDIVHVAAAHATGRGLAHHPAQRFDQVRFAAAIRPDNPGHPRRDLKIERIDEGLEARESKACELHRDGLAAIRALLHQPGDFLLKIGIGRGGDDPVAALLVEDESRSRLDLDILLGLQPLGENGVLQTAIIEAGIDLRVGQPGELGLLLQGGERTDPSLLDMEQGIDHREKPLRRGAAGQHRGLQCRLMQRKIMQDEIDLASIDIVLGHLRQGFDDKGRAVRAIERIIFVDANRRLWVAQPMFDHARIGRHIRQRRLDGAQRGNGAQEH